MGASDLTSTFLYISATLTIIFSISYLLLELFQLKQRGLKKYFTDLENYFDVATYVSVIIFVFPFGHTCWCYPSWKWQTGALAVFLTWIHNFIFLKHIPTAGQPIAMLFNVYIKFLKLLYLPILLIFTFGLPFYMLFIGIKKVCCTYT